MEPGIGQKTINNKACIISSPLIKIPAGIGKLIGTLNPGSEFFLNKNLEWMLAGETLTVYLSWLYALIGDPFASSLFKLLRKNAWGIYRVEEKGILVVSSTPITPLLIPLNHDLLLKVTEFSKFHHMSPSEVILSCVESVFKQI